MSYTMTTISVPLSADLLKALEFFIKQGHATSKADAMRRALKQYLEDQAVQNVLEASKGPFLKGDLRELARKLR